MAAPHARWRALQHHPYRHWAAGMGQSLAGFWAQNLVVAVVLVRTGGGGLTLALFTVAQAVPALVLGPWAGALADRRPVRGLIGQLQLAGAVVAGVAAIDLALDGPPALLLGLALAQGCISAIDLPCRQRLVADLVPASDLPSAIGLQGVLQMGGRAAGGLLAAGALATGTPALAAAANAASFVVLGRVVAGLPEIAATPGRTGERVSAFSGVAIVRDDERLRTPLLMLVLVAGVGAFEVLLPLTGQALGDPGLGALLTTAFAIGAVSASLSVAGRAAPDRRELVAATVATAALFAALAARPSLPVTLLCIAALGRAGGLVIGGVFVTLQCAVEPQHRGRVMGLATMAVNGTTPVGDPLIGGIASAGGVGAAYLAASAGALIAAFTGATHRDRVPLTTATEVPVP